MSIGQGAVAVLFGREGNRRCGVALAMRQTISYIQHSSYGLSGLTEKDEQLPTLLMGYCILYYFSERELTFTFAICYRPSVCRLSVCRL